MKCGMIALCMMMLLDAGELFTPWRPAESDVAYIAKTIYGEANNCSDTEKAGVAWCILNRLDTGWFGENVEEVVTAENQFKGYKAEHPLIYAEIAQDVLVRHHNEQLGVENVGRVLPADYLFFKGNGYDHNYFTKRFYGLRKPKEEWDWSLPSPYKEE